MMFFKRNFCSKALRFCSKRSWFLPGKMRLGALGNTAKVAA